jgi:glycosyltransferase involved in cell wall biosynthesis
LDIVYRHQDAACVGRTNEEGLSSGPAGAAGSTRAQAHEHMSRQSDQAHPRGRVCIQVPGVYPALVPGSGSYVGGLETQQAIALRGLQARGFDTRAVTCAYGQARYVNVQGIGVYRSFAVNEGWPVLRFFHPRLSGTVRALIAADSDVYLTQGSGVLTGITFDVAKALRKPFVFIVAHDDDVRRELPQQTRPHEKWWYRRALKGARLILSQTEAQRRALLRDFKLESTVLPNPIPIPSLAIDPGQPGHVVWVATYKDSKRPMWVVELARQIPNRVFVMHGVVPSGTGENATWRQVREAARDLKNLQLHTDPVNHRLDEVYRNASLFVHASSSEGFPNTFLEAWARGVPGVTAFDPDGIIGRHGLGESVSDLPAFVRSVDAWMSDPTRRREAGARSRAYVQQRHAEDLVIDQLAALLDRVVVESRSAP